MIKSEQDVEDHQAYQQACNDLITWLRGAREKLATCSDTYGDKITITAKADKLQSIANEMPLGSDMIARVKVAGDKVMPSTSCAGQARIQQEHQNLTTDFEDLQSQVAQTQISLEGCLEMWTDYEEASQTFSDWVKNADENLKFDVKLLSTLEEKLKSYNDAQVKNIFLLKLYD